MNNTNALLLHFVGYSLWLPCSSFMNRSLDSFWLWAPLLSSYLHLIDHTKQDDVQISVLLCRQTYKFISFWLLNAYLSALRCCVGRLRQDFGLCFNHAWNGHNLNFGVFKPLALYSYIARCVRQPILILDDIFFKSRYGKLCSPAYFVYCNDRSFPWKNKNMTTDINQNIP